jgi:hypothetical protein
VHACALFARVKFFDVLRNAITDHIYYALAS